MICFHGFEYYYLSMHNYGILLYDVNGSPAVIVLDKRFPIKARLNGLLPVTVDLLKRSLSDPNVVSVILSVVKVMASNG